MDETRNKTGKKAAIIAIVTNCILTILNITVGYADDIIYSFSVDTTESWELLYKNSDKNCIASANLLVIRPDNKQISSEYLLTYLRSAVGQKLIKGLLRGTAMPFINHEDLKGLAVIVPNLPKQDNFIKSYKSKMDKYKKQLDEVRQNIAQLEQDVNDIICGKKQEL